MTIRHLILRQAVSADLTRLMSFYRENASLALPAPSVVTLGSALSTGRFLLIESLDGGLILASAAIFDYSPPGWRTYVGELSGTRVTASLNGFGPIGIQRLLLGARLLGHAATQSAHLQGCSSSLLTVVRSDNHNSIRNVEAAGFARLERRPDWIKYDEHSWNGAVVGDEWSYYVASDATVRQAFSDLAGVGIFGGIVLLSRNNRQTGDLEVVSIRSMLKDLGMALEDLRAIHEGARLSELEPPPDELRE